MTFKNHGCCGHIFAGLDGVRALQLAHGFGPDDVVKVHIGGYSATKDVCDRPVVNTEQEARFLPVHGGRHAGAGRRADRGLRGRRASPIRASAQMPKVSVSMDPELADAYPGSAPPRCGSP
jgi:2-methylcitrate dehydratase PrpD